MKEEYNLRIEAVKRFLAGERPASNIYRSLNKIDNGSTFGLNVTNYRMTTCMKIGQK